MHHAGALVVDQQALRLQQRDHAGDQRIGVGLALPQVKGHAQGAEVALQRRHRDVVHVLPEGPIAGAAGLQFGGRLAGAVTEGRVFLRARGRGRIEPLQILQRDRAFGGVGAVALEISGLAFVFQRRDQQPHLEAPVAEVRVAPDGVAPETEQALQALADDRRAQVADVHRLGDIGAAVVDDDLARLGHGRSAGHRAGGHFGRAFGQRPVRHADIDEARPGDLDRGDLGAVLQMGCDLGRQIARIGPGLFGGGQGAVGLEIGEVGPVRRRDARKIDGQAFGGEGGLDRFAKPGLQVAHWSDGAPALIRKREPLRLNSAISGVTSKPIRTSKLAPDTAMSARGMVRLRICSVT